jgi:hypothetical protein
MSGPVFAPVPERHKQMLPWRRGHAFLCDVA